MFHASPGFSGDEGLGGAGVQESYKAVAGGGGGSAVYFNPGGKRCIVDGNSAVGKAGPVFGNGGRKGKERVRTRCNGRDQNTRRRGLGEERGVSNVIKDESSNYKEKTELREIPKK